MGSVHECEEGTQDAKKTYAMKLLTQIGDLVVQVRGVWPVGGVQYHLTGCLYNSMVT